MSTTNASTPWQNCSHNARAHKKHSRALHFECDEHCSNQLARCINLFITFGTIERTDEEFPNAYISYDLFHLHIGHGVWPSLCTILWCMFRASMRPSNCTCCPGFVSSPHISSSYSSSISPPLPPQQDRKTLVKDWITSMRTISATLRVFAWNLIYTRIPRHDTLNDALCTCKWAPKK